jgi:hypothetical protein
MKRAKRKRAVPLPLDDTRWRELTSVHTRLCQRYALPPHIAALDLTEVMAKRGKGRVRTMRRRLAMVPRLPASPTASQRVWLEHWLAEHPEREELAEAFWSEQHQLYWGGDRLLIVARPVRGHLATAAAAWGYAFYCWLPNLQLRWPELWPEPERQRKGSREQQLIREIADDEWPDGWDHVSTAVLIKRVGDRLKERGEPVPKRDKFLRGLGRRKG